MINSYEIKKYNSEEVLYLYFDFNTEFARINFNSKKEKLEKIIQDFIKENRIAFTGTTVALIVGGTMVGNIILNNDKKEMRTIENSLVFEEKVQDYKPIETIDEPVLEENIQNKVLDKKEEISTKPMEQSTIIKSEKTNIRNENTTLNEIKKETSNNEVNNTTNSSTAKQENKIEETKVEEQSKTYVKVKRLNGQVLNLELEEYIVGVVGAEMPAAFHEQALMAQAVIARTYALKAVQKGQVLTDNESTQSYKSSDELKSQWGSSYNTYYNKIKNAVSSTQGMYLTYNGTYIEAVYHSTSNGRTEDSSNVWGNSFPYLVSVESEYDSLNTSFISEKTITYQELSSKLGIDININTEFNIISKTSGNRVDTLQIDSKDYNGVQFRNLLGLRSADFDIAKTDTGITFTTRGYGHGVGLSQYGANGMAKAGYSYEQILKHYYRCVTINH